MAITSIPNFNRIINIYFLSVDRFGGQSVVKQIICPTHGMKPDIEIVGTMLPGNVLPSFQITIKNLYMDLSGGQYQNIRVEAGYGNKLVPITGQIISIFQESPGPEGKTVIMCQAGTINAWVSSMIDLNEPAGTPVRMVLEKISRAMDMKTPKMPLNLLGLVLPCNFEWQGLAAQALNKLIKLLPDEKLIITENDGSLQVSTTKTLSLTVKKYLNFLQAPPQQNPGGGEGDGAYYTTVTGPWMPDLRPGMQLVFPAWQYIRFRNLINRDSTQNSIIVTSIQFHFGTVGGVNQMTVQGPGAGI